MSFQEAAVAAGKSVTDWHAPSSRKRRGPPLDPPSGTWQSKATEVAEEAEALLWQPEGAQALAYLRLRGFKDETIKPYSLHQSLHIR